MEHRPWCIECEYVDNDFIKKCAKFEADTDFSVTEAHEPHKLKDGKFNSSKSDLCQENLCKNADEHSGSPCVRCGYYRLDLNTLDASTRKDEDISIPNLCKHPESHSQVDLEQGSSVQKESKSPDTFASLIAELDLYRKDTYQYGFIEGVLKAQKIVEDAISKLVEHGGYIEAFELKKELGI